MIKNIEGVQNAKVMHRDHFIFAVVLVVIAALAFLFSCQKILKIVENGCFNKLQEYARVVSHQFIMNNLHYPVAMPKFNTLGMRPMDESALSAAAEPATTNTRKGSGSEAGIEILRSLRLSRKRPKRNCVRKSRRWGWMRSAKVSRAP